MLDDESDEAQNASQLYFEGLLTEWQLTKELHVRCDHIAWQNLYDMRDEQK